MIRERLYNLGSAFPQTERVDLHDIAHDSGPPAQPLRGDFHESLVAGPRTAAGRRRLVIMMNSPKRLDLVDAREALRFELGCTHDALFHARYLVSG
jgi:hypothetical protein